MPGPTFTEGTHVSLHPIEEEDHEFIQYGLLADEWLDE